MLSFGPNVRLSLQEQKAELQDKIQLLGTAFYERSQSVIKKNHEIILQLRPANQKLHKELAQVILLLRCILFISLKHKLSCSFHNILLRSTSGIIACLWASPQNFRMLENRLDKFQFKCKEAEKCRKINVKLKAQMQAQRTVLEADDLDSEAQQSTRVVPEEEKVNPIFEEILKNLKEATGVSDLQDVLEHFTSEKENCESLENLKKQNEEALEKLKEEKELLRQQFDKMKYSGEAKLSSKIKKLEECEQQLQDQLQRRDADAECHSTFTSTFRLTVQFIFAKPFKSFPTSDEFVLELLNQCGTKLWVLLEELEGKDMASVMKEIEEDEFFTTIEGRLPKTNTKVQLPYKPVKDIGKEESELREDELDIISRDALKRQSQLIIENNLSKKKNKDSPLKKLN
uniref:Coiled-coil domain containing 151 n=1 Tax=Poecilia reticulata TaxID=8081 RepID=A0A3P9MTL4_POERE